MHVCLSAKWASGFYVLFLVSSLALNTWVPFVEETTEATGVVVMPGSETEGAPRRLLLNRTGTCEYAAITLNRH